MSTTTINQKAILEKLNIESLNKMQNQAFNSITSRLNTVLLSPTGTGKTLAFLLPVIRAFICPPGFSNLNKHSQITTNTGGGLIIFERYHVQSA